MEPARRINCIISQAELLFAHFMISRIFENWNKAICDHYSPNLDFDSLVAWTGISWLIVDSDSMFCCFSSLFPQGIWKNVSFPWKLFLYVYQEHCLHTIGKWPMHLCTEGQVLRKTVILLSSASYAKPNQSKPNQKSEPLPKDAANYSNMTWWSYLHGPRI